MSYPASIEKALAYLNAADIPNYLKNEKMWFVHRIFWKQILHFLLLYWQVFLLISFILALMAQ